MSASKSTIIRTVKNSTVGTNSINATTTITTKASIMAMNPSTRITAIAKNTKTTNAPNNNSIINGSDKIIRGAAKSASMNNSGSKRKNNGIKSTPPKISNIAPPSKRNGRSMINPMLKSKNIKNIVVKNTYPIAKNTGKSNKNRKTPKLKNNDATMENAVIGMDKSHIINDITTNAINNIIGPKIDAADTIALNINDATILNAIIGIENINAIIANTTQKKLKNIVRKIIDAIITPYT
jgi:hypothetical protein